MKIPEIKISLKVDKFKKSELTSITSSKQGYEIFRTLFNADTIDWLEESIILCLNRSNRVLGYYKLSSGGTAGTMMDPKVIFTIALNCSASAIIVAHNHPSGNLTPSQPDIKTTENIKKLGDMMGITLLDHIIVTDEGFYSFSDDNKL